MKRTLLIVLASLTLAVMACNVGGIGIRQDEMGQTVISVSIPEQTVNDLVKQAVTNVNVNGRNIITEVRSIDMKPGAIAVSGKADIPNLGVVDATFDVLISVSDGRLSVQLANVVTSGGTLDQSVIDQINRNISASLSAQALGNRDAKITAVRITDTEMQVEITLPKQ